MYDTTVYDTLRHKMRELAQEHDLLSTQVVITTAILTPEQAIGQPERQDFPLLKGKEKMVEADLGGSRGQAFTNWPGTFQGSLTEILALPLADNHERALFVSALNALARHTEKVGNTRHCRNEGPKLCGQKIVAYIQEHYGKPKLGMVGLQPALLAACAPAFPLRVLDLDPENIGQKKEGTLIEDGMVAAQDVAQWADLLFVTGSTLVNNTIGDWLNLDKPVVFFGNTIAGAAEFLGLKRFCPYSD
ncbi:Putative heavy-metal chelation domain protein [Acididesulfobacillus acetoxydans]|uniref:Heavy-metal chelation domain protein n=1 Tax=Acididesulfobacillus acetoxydans TaxID=1561005 RepID=A0A8S0W6L2_9FIRM|nr:DUF364 domain-containing protein [Acididesulfobacillus acetoxydans]CAA7599949.1 Putative heavy-metal chelation domain protein [Acididesulfobacillus acetoxydans]CEJ07959.1 Membrane protein [Acididesulfobacillus acetoxydans]